MNNAAEDVIQSIKDRPMTGYQIWIIVLCTMIAALDGFDVLVVAYTGPAISSDWGLTATELGTLFGAGLAGMGVGAVAIAPLGDLFGRRPIILVCMLALLIGMGLSAYTADVKELAAMRFFTGLGIGAILASINIMASEFSSERWKALCIALMSVGYPIGATLGGIVAVYLLDMFGWRSVYLFGATVAAILLPLVLFWMPESVDYLLARQPAGALSRCNRILKRIGLPTLQAMPARRRAAASNAGWLGRLLTDPEITRTALFACGAYFCLMLTCYFLLSWTPQILTRSGLTQDMGISGSLVMNTGGMIGCVLYGVLAQRLGARRLAAIVMLGLFLSALLFAATPPSPVPLLLSAWLVGFCLFTAISCLYVLVPGALPAQVRSTGTGLAMGAGRLGAVVGPVVAGHLIAAGMDKLTYIAILSMPVIIAAIAIIGLRPLSAAPRQSPTPV